MNAEAPERTVRAILVESVDEPRSSLSWTAMWSFARAYWLVIMVCAFLGAAGAVALSFAFPRIYRAEILLAPTDTGNDSGGLEGLLSRYGGLASAVGIGGMTGNRTVPTAIARLQSRSFLERFIVEQNIMPVLFPDEEWTIDPQAKAVEGKRVRTLQDGYLRFTRSIMLVKHDKQSDLVTIRIDCEDRELAAKWANTLVTSLNSVMRSIAIDETERNLTYLRSELGKADYIKLKDSISSLMETQINKRMLALTQPDFAFRVIDAAKPADYNKKVAPKRSVFMILGMLAGGMIGVLLAVRRRNRRASTGAGMAA